MEGIERRHLYDNRKIGTLWLLISGISRRRRSVLACMDMQHGPSKSGPKTNETNSDDAIDKEDNSNNGEWEEERNILGSVRERITWLGVQWGWWRWRSRRTFGAEDIIIIYVSLERVAGQSVSSGTGFPGTRTSKKERAQVKPWISS